MVLAPLWIHMTQATVFSSIDREGRYAYGNQPGIAGWNLARFAETLLPLLHQDKDEAVKIAQAAVSNYLKLYQENFLAGMRSKLGIFNEEAEDGALIEQLLDIMKQNRADFTNTFRSLTINRPDETPMAGSPEFTQWYDTWQARLERQPESKDTSQNLMEGSNPVVIPRNHRVEEALAAAVNNSDYSVMEKLLAVLTKPYEYTTTHKDYCNPPEPTAKPYRTFCGT